MLLFGLHILDVIILLIFLVAIVVIGWRVSHTVKKETDLFLGGRRLGHWLQFFLNFGNMADSTGAVTLSSEVFRQGVGGMWLQFQTVFFTPFHWFLAPWFRRVRLITMGDIFVDRFGSKGLASAFALFNIVIALIQLGAGNLITYKVASAMIVKPDSELTVPEREAVAMYQEFGTLKKLAAAAQTPAQKLRLEELDNRSRRGELKAFVSYVTPGRFYMAYTAIVALYIIMGGLRAAAIIDALQGTLILIMSLIMIPIGLYKIGGLHALHAQVTADKFQLFGTVAMSEYTWYSILAVILTSLVQIYGVANNMAIWGSARSERAARMGAVTGGITKRFVLIGWMLCGLIALALVGGQVSDPDNAWGTLSRTILIPGLSGLMLSGMLLGHMPAVGAAAVAVSGLMTRNLYVPLLPGKSDKHYLRAGQVLIALVLLAAIGVAMWAQSVTAIITTMITFNAYFGAVMILTFFWRRTTPGAVWGGLILFVAIVGLLPLVVPYTALRRAPALIAQTAAQTVRVNAGATAEDVREGKARAVGEVLRKDYTIPAKAAYFDAVARVNPADPASPLQGMGRFNCELYVMHLVGFPVELFTAAGLRCGRWAFDGIFPFICVMLLSFVTPGAERERVRRFYGKMKTPVAATPEEDEREMALTMANPGRFDHLKLFPNSQWEHTKWTRLDTVGFLACWGIVGVILLLLVGLLQLGK